MYDDEDLPFGGALSGMPEGASYSAGTDDPIMSALGALTPGMYTQGEIDQVGPMALGALKRGLAGMDAGTLASAQSAQAKKAALQQAYDALLNQKPDHTALMLGMASGFLAPTRTGGFGESLGLAGQGAMPGLIAGQKTEQDRKLAMLKYQLGLGDTDLEAAKAQATSGHQQAQIGSQLLRDVARSRAAEAKGAGPISPAGKQALDEGLKPGTPEFTKRVEDIGKLDVPGSLEKREKELELKRESEKIENMPKIEGSLRSLRTKQGIVNTAVDDAIAAANNWSTGWGAKLFGNLPKTEALQMQGLLDTIRANVGFDELTEMRANSPTGGALGQVSDKENQLLQALKGSLNPLLDAPTMKKNLTTIKKLYGDVLREREAAFEKDYAKHLKKRDDGASPSVSGGKRRVYNPATGQFEETQ